MPKLFQSIAAFLLIGFVSISNAKPNIKLINLAEKPPAPNFKLADINGEFKTLDDYLGNPVVINFWATWCPPCIAELPSLNRAQERLKEDGVKFIAININEDLVTIQSFLRDHPIEFDVLRDESSAQLANWNMTGLPTTFILDSKGRVAYQALGDREWDNDSIIEKIKKLKSDTAAKAAKK